MVLHYIALGVLLPGMAIFGWMAATTLQRASEGVAWSLGVYFALVIPGLAGAALQIVADDATTLAVAKVAMFICRAGIPVALIALVFDMMGRPFRSGTLVALSVIPVLTLLMALTNSAHGLLWSAELVDGAGQLVVHPDWGPWYRYVHAPYSYTLLGTMMAIFFLRLSAVSAPQRRSMMLFLVISLGPMLTGILHSFGVTIDRLWLPAVSVSLTAPLFLWIIDDLRHHRFRPVSYRELIEQINDPVIGLDLADRVVSINPAASELFGADPASLLGKALPQKSAMTDALQKALASSSPLTHGGRRYEVRKSDVLADDGSRRGQTIICRDITTEQQARDELSTNEQLMRTIVEQSSEGIVRLHGEPTNPQDPSMIYRCVFANGAAAEWAGVEKSALEGRDVREILALILNNWDGNESSLVAGVLNSLAQGQIAEQELCLGSGDQSQWLRLVAEPVGNEVAMTLTDITTSMRRQLAAEQRASYDQMTGVLNRGGFVDAAEAMVKSASRGVLMFVDLNGFKQVNDEFGHPAGDGLLKKVASRLADACRPQDLVGRYGGDEFVVLAAGLTPEAELKLARRVTHAMSQAYSVGKHNLSCTASIGRARFPEHGLTLESLLAHADSEMYRVKRAASGPVIVPAGGSSG